MKELSCVIIRDLLPLYHDEVCSQESKLAVEAHLAQCADCRLMLEKMNSEPPVSFPEETAVPLKKLAKKWRSGMLTAFYLGAFLISVLAIPSCFAVYGTQPTPEFGTFSPVGYVFVALALLFGALLVIRLIQNHRRKKK